ncbi:hypothetical protein J6590_042159 [Homalodisca vitripennis]|nr:hypothetical protein J6590_042159 [Homalodisca vitripennis]
MSPRKKRRPALNQPLQSKQAGGGTPLLSDTSVFAVPSGLEGINQPEVIPAGLGVSLSGSHYDIRVLAQSPFNFTVVLLSAPVCDYPTNPVFRTTPWEECVPSPRAVIRQHRTVFLVCYHCVSSVPFLEIWALMRAPIYTGWENIGFGLALHSVHSATRLADRRKYSGIFPSPAANNSGPRSITEAYSDNF